MFASSQLDQLPLDQPFFVNPDLLFATFAGMVQYWDQDLMLHLNPHFAAHITNGSAGPPFNPNLPPFQLVFPKSGTATSRLMTRIASRNLGISEAAILALTMSPDSKMLRLNSDEDVAAYVARTDGAMGVVDSAALSAIDTVRIT